LISRPIDHTFITNVPRSLFVLQRSSTPAWCAAQEAQSLARDCADAHPALRGGPARPDRRW
ncbi:unnamed protein product, partial [Durusdinium trenchii]